MGRGARVHGLRVVFDPALDSGGWPGALGDRDACVGESWLGPYGLIDRLETELGLGALRPRAAQRSAHLAGELAKLDGYWRASFEADALGTARRLLADRDALWLWGWRGQPVSDRLSALARATSSALPGLPDRLYNIARALDSRRPDFAALELCSPEALMPTRWRVVFEKLRAFGVNIRHRRVAPVAARGDLMAARRAEFVPSVDGTLTLLRCHGPLAAADEVAGWLARRESLQGVLLVDPDVVLADALARCGLPRPRSPRMATASVSALRLVIEAMFRPADPAQLYALLTLNPGPIPAAIAYHLIGALERLPGRGSPFWRDALANGLARIDEQRRERVRQRVDALLLPAVARDEHVGVGEVVGRLRVLSAWARGAAKNVASVLAVGLAADSLASTLTALGTERFSRVQLLRFLDEQDDFDVDAHPAQAGIATVQNPGAVLGGARTIIWWGFTRHNARRPPRLRLSHNERAALNALGVTPPDPGVIARAEALRWRRPLQQASDALVLVCPRTTENGDKAFPHPLWDELTASMGGPQVAGKLVCSELTLPERPQRTAAPLRALPEPSVEWRAGGSLEIRASGESASSLEGLLGCSLAWALSYHGKLRRRVGPPATPGGLLFGKLAHHVLAEVFAAGAILPQEAEAKAAEVIERDLGQMCETLLLPRFQVEHAELKQAVIASAAELARLVQLTGSSVRGVETALDRDLPELRLIGTADLLLENPDIVIDLKWGKTVNRAKLASGTALQLAAYAEMARVGANRPEVGYFILRTQQLLAEPGTTLPDAESPGDALAIDMWRGAMTALADRKAELGRGLLCAPGALGDDVVSELTDDRMVIGPGCQYCSLDTICGRGGAR